MTRDIIANDYFEWLRSIVCANRYDKQISYVYLLERLHSINFRYSIPRDHNRAEDGINMRYRFAVDTGYRDCPNLITDYLDGPCSVLEMMVALAIRCEETIMDDPDVGDRTTEWFWSMITNLGLGFMTDSKYDRQYVDFTVARFLDRAYEPDGKGGLFTIRNCDRDLRTVEIWYQLCWYLDSIT